MRINRYSKFMPVVGTALYAGLSGSAMAYAMLDSAAAEQDAAAASAPAPALAAGGASLNEIVVTAQRRAASLQDVPVSISAFSGADLAAKGISTTQDLALIVPSLSFTNFNGQSTAYIRGIGKNILGPMGESPVAFYVDGVYVASPYSILSSLSDIERVEVLRGPQGTLYGRNSTGGAVNLITREPSSEFTTDGSLSYGNFDAFEAKAYMSGGTDTVAISVAGIYSTRDGYMTNRFNGQRVDDANLAGGRVKVKVTPTDLLTVTFAADYSESWDYAGEAIASLSERPRGLLFGGRVGQSPRETYLDTTGDSDRKSRLNTGGETLNIRAELGAVDFVSISAHRYSNKDNQIDLDATDAFLLTATAPDMESRTFSQELQLLSNNDGPLEWIVGGYFFDIKGGFKGLEMFAPPSPTVPIVRIDSLLQSTAYAAFAQATYRFDDHWSLTLGGRYSHETIKRKKIDTYLPDQDLLIPAARASETFNSFDPKVTLEYHFDETMLYATASTGFKSGSFSESAEAPAVEPEDIKAFELGGKHTLGRRMYLNWSGFYYDYKNLQVTITNNIGQVALENAAKARIYGVEADLNVALSSDLNVTVSATWLSAKYKNYPGGAVYVPDPSNGGYGNVIQLQDLSGKRLTNAPEFAASVGFSYRLPVSAYDIHLSGNYQYNDGEFYDVANTVRQNSYHMLNLRLDADVIEDRLTVSAWVNNAFDKTILRGVSMNADAILASYAPPRFYGVGISWKY